MMVFIVLVLQNQISTRGEVILLFSAIKKKYVNNLLLDNIKDKLTLSLIYFNNTCNSIFTFTLRRKTDSSFVGIVLYITQ